MTETDHLTESRGVGPLPPADLADPPPAAQRNWGWIVALGVVLILGGVAAALMPALASIAVEAMVGAVFAVGGVCQVIHAVRTEGWRARAWALVSGALYLLGAALLVLNPLAGLMALTLVMATLFLLDGGLRIAMGLKMRPEKGWGWIAVGGVASAILGALIVALFPGISLTILGLLVAVGLIFEGWGYVFLGLAAKRAQDRGGAA